METTDSFGGGEQSQIECGDIVTWKRLGEKRNIGMVYDVYVVQMGGRSVKKASVASFQDTLHYELLLLELKIVTKGN